MTVKQCSKCKHERPLTSFYKRASSKDGLRPDCKECAIADSKRWYEENKRRAAEWHKQYRADNAEKCRLRSLNYRIRNKDGIKKRKAAYQKANRKAISAKELAHYHANPEKTKARNSRWQKAHPEAVRAKAQRWRENNPDKARMQRLARYHSSIERFRALNKARHAVRAATLSDAYVRAHVSRGTPLRPSDIPQELVEAKRGQLKVKRIIKEKRK